MIERLNAETPEDTERLGGKGCGIVRLIQAGIPVPEAWILPARLPSPSQTGADILDKETRQALVLFWQAFQEAFPGRRLAVRSSAVAEDQADASFAGVYRTVLNVTGPEALLAAVERCLSAIVSDEASVYRSSRGVSPGDDKIALVLQRMVDSDTAGVLLTTNPLRPFAEEGVINASYGLGEAIVSGLTHPDEIVFDKTSGVVLRTTVGSKEREIRYVAGKGEMRLAVRKGLRARMSLSEEQIRRLIELGRDVENRIGPDQDCEWAFQGDRLYALQQRPITGLPPRNPQVVWSRKFGDEYLAEYTLPLGYTLLGGWISEVFLEDFARKLGFARRLSHPPTLRHKGYAYVSGEYILHLFRSVPRRMRHVESLGWFTPLWERRVNGEPFRPVQLLRAVTMMLADPYASVRRNPDQLRDHADEIERIIVPRLSQDYALLTDAEWDRQFNEAVALGIRHFHIIRWGMGVHNTFLHGLLKLLLETWWGTGNSDLYPALISGLPGTRTTEMNHAVWRLGEAARRDESLRDAILAQGPYGSLRDAFAASPFWGRFEDFLSRYGHRSASREISQPRWHETPELVLGFVRAQIADNRAGDPRRVEEKTRRRRVHAEREAFVLAGRGALGPLKKGLLRQVVRMTQIYTQYRENQRFHLDYLLDHLRRLILEMARRFTNQGILDSAEDIFFLEAQTFNDIRKGAFSAEIVGRNIREQKKEYELWRYRIPATYLFDGIETEGEIAEGPCQGPDMSVASARFHGTPASIGIVEGAVRVIPTVGDLDRIRPGEILVTSNTDPGWTSVFPRLGGLVTETGGMLSHGALLAREYGIPAVTGVAHATRLLRTGRRVRLDGRSGIVELL